MSFNFGRIGDIVSKVMDSDYIDIKREKEGKLEEIYSNVPCHISYNSVDNPDPLTVDVKPIIQNINLNMPNWVDIKNNDFIIAKKMSSDNKVIAIYSGRCGNPAVSQSRKKVLMMMNATEPEPPTPVPPQDPSFIVIKYLYDEKEIKPANSKEVEAGQSITLFAPEIEGYKVVNSRVDGVIQDSEKVYISRVDENGNMVEFLYDKNLQPTDFRFLVNGIFTKDDSSLATGYHLYKAVKINNIEETESGYTIRCNDVVLTHGDSGKKLEVKPGVKMALMPQKIFVEVTFVTKIENNEIIFKVVPFIPTEAEEKAYVTRWYD